MALEKVEETQLWIKTLAQQEDDSASRHRDRLRNAFLTMRENTIPFVRNIHRDVLGLTVHDESHLDALWETADKIAGPNFNLTPVESFVFGAAVLLHDTALAIAAYPGGIAELKETIVWKDAEEGVRTSTNNKDDNLSKSDIEQVLFSALRSLHAEQAEKLISFTFKRPNRDEAIPLLQDVGLLDALGAAIGRIAHSHHWNASDLENRLTTVAGTVPSFPADWTLNEVKVACLLRCADASHIDSRRAPTMLYAISSINGVSKSHWNFQNKLNQVSVNKDKLVYYAGQAFGVDDASAWWQAYDTMGMIDYEIKSCNAILEDIGNSSFQVKGVQGVETPRLLSSTVHVSGWTPVSAEVRVSDPVHLARTLGGRNLYGSGPLAPVRELLQNAVDAVHARRTHQNRDSDWGKVRLTLESPNSTGDIWLHVDDNGTGMSERVLTGPLIDFGKSFWSSSLLEEEFPGLRSNRPKLVGKFGIGFFSVFLLGDAVRVITRRFDAAESSAQVLSFDELTRRPLLRKAATGELPLDYTTRVSVKLSTETIHRVQKSEPNSGIPRYATPNWFAKSILNLIVAADVDIEIIDRLNSLNYKHSGNWTDSSAASFISEVCSTRSDGTITKLVDLYGSKIRPLINDDGDIVGRAAFCFGENQRNDGHCLISVGGFSTMGRDHRADFEGLIQHEQSHLNYPQRSILGVLMGETNDAARMSSATIVSKSAFKRWAEEQATLIDTDAFTAPQLVPVCHQLLRFGAVASNLPFGFLGGNFATVDDFKGAIAGCEAIYLPMSHSDYQSSFALRSISELTTPFYTSRLLENVAVIIPTRVGGEILTENDRRGIISTGGMELHGPQISTVFSNYPLKYLLAITTHVWGKSPKVYIEHKKLDAANINSGLGESWVVSIIK